MELCVLRSNADFTSSSEDLGNVQVGVDTDDDDDDDDDHSVDIFFHSSDRLER